MIERVIWIVLDSVGMGAMPDAEDFGDAGANTIAHTAEACGGLEFPICAVWAMATSTGCRESNRLSVQWEHMAGWQNAPEGRTRPSGIGK